jgi:hypothetical protein
MDFLRRDEYKCDTCSRAVNRGDSYVVSGRTIRQNRELAQHYRSLDENVYFQLFVRDWTDWLICTEDMIRWHFPVTVRRQP